MAVVHPARNGRPIVCLISDRDGCADLRPVFPRMDFETREFTSAEAFLADDRPATTRCIVLLELNGNGPGGLEFLERLRERDAHLPVIVLAERGTTVPVAVRAIRAGAAAFIEKPFLHSLLIREIRRILAQPDGPGTSARDADRGHAPSG